MRGISIPHWLLWRQSPQLATLDAALGGDSREGLCGLWSWASDHGAGPHAVAAVERGADWRGDVGFLARSLVDSGWAARMPDGRLMVLPWQDVLGVNGATIGEPVPANETPQERRRRQTREAMRRKREKEKAEKLHPQSVVSNVSIGERSVSLGEQNVSFGERNVSGCERDVSFCEPNVSNIGQFLAPSRARSLSLSSYSEKYSEEEPEAEGEQNTEVVVAAGASTVMAVRSAPEGHGFSAIGEAGGQTTLFALSAVSPSARPVAIGQERPAIASGSTIGAEVRSVPVPASDRASEGNGGGRGKKGRGGKKAAVDPQAVEGPIRQVWTAYAEVVGGRVVLSRERAELIADRLADGWTADDLVEAVRGFAKSAWHFGANDRGTRFTTIELWLRDSAHVEQGLGFHKEAAKPAAAPKAVDPIKNPPKNGFEEKFAKYFEEKRLKEAEKAAREQA